jgi:hypothetical protein
MISPATIDLAGIKVRLDRPVDRERPCCRNVCTIRPARPPHVGEFIRDACGRHRGWLSKSTASWIEKLVACFGPSTTPIVVRKTHTYE